MLFGLKSMRSIDLYFILIKIEENGFKFIDEINVRELFKESVSWVGGGLVLEYKDYVEKYEKRELADRYLFLVNDREGNEYTIKADIKCEYIEDRLEKVCRIEKAEGYNLDNYMELWFDFVTEFRWDSRDK